MRIEGHVSSGFEPVRQAFAENFSRRRELGGACCVYLRGEKVVDLWGGMRDQPSGAPWQEDTMVLVYSATCQSRREQQFPERARSQLQFR